MKSVWNAGTGSYSGVAFYANTNYNGRIGLPGSSRAATSPVPTRCGPTSGSPVTAADPEGGSRTGAAVVSGPLGGGAETTAVPAREPGL